MMNSLRRPIQTRVRESILDAIRSGSIRGGQTLSIQTLADTLGVSVTPIREALSSLAGDGVLDLIPGGLVSVPAMTRAHLEEWLWLRRVIESRLIERGLERKTPADAAAIADLASDVSRITPDVELCIQIGSAVIDRLVALAGQEVLLRNLSRVRNRCAGVLAAGQRHAGVEVAVCFVADIAAAFRAGADRDVCVTHGRYLDSVDAAALAIMDRRQSEPPDTDDRSKAPAVGRPLPG